MIKLKNFAFSAPNNMTVKTYLLTCCYVLKLKPYKHIIIYKLIRI